MDLDRSQDILDFWFLPEDHDDYGKMRDEWFTKDNDFDAEIRERFHGDLETAAAGHYLSWTESKKGCLALIILFDQFPRNMFRDSGQAFETDAKAREIARHMILKGFLDTASKIEKQFTYLPFEHSENLQDQKYSLQLFAELEDEVLMQYAQAHHDIVKRFGRFPHRNLMIGRSSTAEEEKFLQEPGSSF